MGEMGFCFKRGKVFRTAPSSCDDLEIKLDGDMQKRWVLEEKENRRKKSPPGETNGVSVLQRPLGSKDFILPKKNRVENHLYLDALCGSEIYLKNDLGFFTEDQNLLMTILIGGLIILSIILSISGVF